MEDEQNELKSYILDLFFDGFNFWSNCLHHVIVVNNDSNCMHNKRTNNIAKGFLYGSTDP
jgi:hypothetical protein